MLLLDSIGVAYYGFYAIEQATAVWDESIEGAGAGQVLDLAFIDHPRIEPASEI